MPRLTINGNPQQVDVDPDTPLLWVLRDTLGLTGTRYGCGIAQCGACTVHIDGVATRSCSVPVSAAEGAQITTIEGLSPNGGLHPVQKSCGRCHDDNWGKRLAGALIPQGHPTGYPVYRLEWQSLGSLQRRLRNCMIGVRAKPFEYGALEAVALELYLMARAHGMPIETPAVRP